MRSNRVAGIGRTVDSRQSAVGFVRGGSRVIVVALIRHLLVSKVEMTITSGLSLDIGGESQQHEPSRGAFWQHKQCLQWRWSCKHLPIGRRWRRDGRFGLLGDRGWFWGSGCVRGESIRVVYSQCVVHAVLPPCLGARVGHANIELRYLEYNDGMSTLWDGINRGGHRISADVSRSTVDLR